MKKHQCALYLLWLGLEMILWWLQKWFRAPIKTYDIGSLSCCGFQIPTQKLCIYTFCMQKLYKMYATDVYKMHTKCIPHFDKLLYTFCVQN